MAASSSSILSSLPSWCPPDCSAWERAYWEQGPAAAERYCTEKVARLEQIKEALKQIAGLFSQDSETCQVISQMVQRYAKKQQRYQRDWASLNPETKGCRLNISGRGEPGRHPFNFPSFRRRYTSLDDLQTYFTARADEHGMRRQNLTSLLPSDDSEQAGILKIWIDFHEAAYKKWFGRRMQINALGRMQAGSGARSSKTELLSETLQRLVVPCTARAPLQIMRFDQEEYLGHRTTISVFEHACDTTHQELAGSVIDLTRKVGQSLSGHQKHGTMVCGIIRRAAPSAQIEVFNNVFQLKRRIINFSGWFPNPFTILGSEPKLLEECVTSTYSESSTPVKRLRASASLGPSPKKREMKEIGSEVNKKEYAGLFGDLRGKLLIQAIGNQGIVLDQNEAVAQGFQCILDSDQQREHAIFVVNLLPNGVYPCSSSNLPGKTVAEMTLSAIGTDILSTIPGNLEEKGTGSSFAAPFVTAAAALIEGEFPKLTTIQIRRCLLQSATPIVLDEYGIPRLVTLPDRLSNYPQERVDASRAIYGMGLLNVERALEMAKSIAVGEMMPSLGKSDASSSSSSSVPRQLFV